MFKKKKERKKIKTISNQTANGLYEELEQWGHVVRE